MFIFRPPFTSYSLSCCLAHTAHILFVPVPVFVCACVRVCVCELHFVKVFCPFTSQRTRRASSSSSASAALIFMSCCLMSTVDRRVYARSCSRSRSGSPGSAWQSQRRLACLCQSAGVAWASGRGPGMSALAKSCLLFVSAHVAIVAVVVAVVALAATSLPEMHTQQ